MFLRREKGLGEEIFLGAEKTFLWLNFILCLGVAGLLYKDSEETLRRVAGFLLILLVAAVIVLLLMLPWIRLSLVA